MRPPTAKPSPRLLLPFIAAILGASWLAACVGGKLPTTSGGEDRNQASKLALGPEGPPVEEVQATASGAVVAPAPGKDAFAVSFPSGNGMPTAIFSFKETDIDDRMGLALDLRNSGRTPVRVYADLDGDTWVRGYVTALPGKTSTLYVFARRKKLSESETNAFPYMHGIPGGKMSLWSGVDEPVMAQEIKVFVVAPREEARLLVSNIRPFGSSKLPDLNSFYPFIDKYGQYNHKDWPGKVHTNTDIQATRLREDADLAAHPAPGDYDKYGGWAAGPQLKATGHFRVEKYQGKWWFVDPDGRLFWSDGLDCVGFNQSSTRIAGRERFYEDPAPNGDFLNRNLAAKYGTNWYSITTLRLAQRMRSWGLNTLGGGADRTIIQLHQIPYTVQLGSGVGRGGGTPGTTAFEQNLRSVFARAAANYKDDPWCIGFFVDNEIHASSDPAWFENYYRQVGAVAREFMPDTLYLGSRLDYHDWPDYPPARFEIVRNAAKYCDVVSFNFYKFTLDDFALPEGVDKPVIIGEFHMGALDRGQFHTGLRSVVDQDQRAEGYRCYVTSALQNPAIVGAHWFQCYDESTTGRFDGENYQIGFLDICDTPYWETVGAARDVGHKLYKIRAGKGINTTGPDHD
jgi:hypothetical protein